MNFFFSKTVLQQRLTELRHGTATETASCEAVKKWPETFLLLNVFKALRCAKMAQNRFFTASVVAAQMRMRVCRQLQSRD